MGHDEDLRGEAVRLTNRLKGLLLSIFPALQRARAAHLEGPGVLDLLATYPTPDAPRRARAATLEKTIAKKSPRSAAKIARAVKDALAERCVVVPQDRGRRNRHPRVSRILSGKFSLGGPD